MADRGRHFGLFTFTDLTRGIAWLLQIPYESRWRCCRPGL
jgi:hypothetical protein